MFGKNTGNAPENNAKVVKGTFNPLIGDLVSFEVLKPFCGLEKGQKRNVKLNSSILQSEKDGLIRISEAEK